MRLALVINRSGGSFRRLPLDATVAAICAVLGEGGHHVEPQIVSRRDLARTLSDAARRPDLDAVVIGGGDGTILTGIVAGLGRDKPLGILPLGTLNLFARDLGLPADPIEAARVLANASPAHIDLAEVNGLPFAIWASLGMHPWIVRRRDHLQRDGMRKWRAMVLAALRAFRRYPMVDVTLDLPEGHVVVRTPMLFITNNAWREETPPLSRQSLDSGTLEIHVAACSGRLSLLWLMAETVIGHWRGSRRLQTFVTREVRVTSPKHRIMVSLDGEVTVMASPLVFKARPQALRVLMPPRPEAP
ncbi:sphingosine kinase [Paramagnetospirillum marisnigri]|uniref:Sphingosine kinase n=1 Tax=Paramagnetospirillum marisnigri TaxID=1285242 RepID=A0A178M5A1_9PROT|nr:lipid kinase MamU [Paramagnetospirillum marisnigri]OAN43939.1 sphingosine kinase [Paramagnetospirillum marisnigri]